MMRLAKIVIQMTMLRNQMMSASDDVGIGCCWHQIMLASDNVWIKCPGEDWGMFPTRIGDKYLTANPCQIYADARVYYSSHFVRKRLEQATSAAITAVAAAAAASIKPIAVGLDEDSPRVLAIDNRDNRTMRMRGRGRGRGGRGLQRKEYPTDPDGYCTFDRRAGHTTEQCRARLQPPTTDIQCYNCNKFGHKPPDCPERNRYAPSSVSTPTSMSSMPTPPPREPPIQPQAPPRIRMIRTPASGISVHPSEEPRIRMIRAPTSGISAHLFNASDDTSHAWIFDTACTHHMANNHELFHDYNQFPTPIAVCGIGSGEHLTYGRGTLHIASLHNGQASNEHHLEYVLYVPEMDINIISKSWTKRCGLKVRMDENEDFLIANDKGMCLQHGCQIHSRDVRFIEGQSPTPEEFVNLPNRLA
jgi:Pol polyprotein, beta-barrel domain